MLHYHLSNQYFTGTDGVSIKRHNLTGALGWAAKHDVPFESALDSLTPLFTGGFSFIGTKPFYSEALSKAASDLKNGFSLSNTLEKNLRWWLPDYYIDSVRMAEEEGCLSETLQQLAETSQRTSLRKKEIFGALFYPLSVLFIISVVYSWIAINIMPRFEKIFEDLSGGLLYKQSQMFSYLETLKFTSSYFAIFMLMQIGLLIYIFFFTNKLDPLLSHVPIIRRPILKWNKLEGVQSLATFLKMGKPVSEALELVIQAQMKSKVRKQFQEVLEAVNNGIPFEQAWSKVFPNDSLENFYIVNGLKRGNLPENLDYLASHLHDSENIRISFLVKILEPVLIILISLLVGWLVSSIYSTLSGIINILCEQII